MTEKNKIYTAADFAYYHAGTMPAGEMHALEKAALEDPFLADALEGYACTAAAENDIAALTQRLNEKIKKKNVFLLSSFTNKGWLRIAAIFIVMAGAGYILYNANKVNKQSALAQNEIPPAVVAKEKNKPVFKTATTTLNNSIVSEDQQVITKKEKIILQPATSGPAEEKQISIIPSQTATAPVAANNTPNDLYAARENNADVKKDEQAVPKEKYYLKGKLADEKGKPVAFASIRDKKSNSTTITDTAGRFVLQSPDSSINAVASAAGYEPKPFNLNKNAQPTIEINKQEAGLSEVVVTGYGVRKSKKESANISKTLNGRAAGVQISTTAPKPAIGKIKYDEYLKEKTKAANDSTVKHFAGEVLLSFSINKNGRPKNITVVNSSCPTCNNKAIKMLLDGPGWRGKTGIKQTLLIKF